MSLSIIWLLCSCSAPHSDHDLVPPGVYVSPSDLERDEVDGLWLNHADPPCCWLAPIARVRFVKPRDAKAIILTFSVIDIVKFRKHPPFVDLGFGGKVLVHQVGVRPGINRIGVGLPIEMQSRTGLATVDIQTSGFVPAAEHLTIDKRQLGFHLTSIEPR